MLQFQAALLQRWNLPEVMCPFCPFVQVLSVNVSIFTLTAIAIDRHRAILSPLRFVSSDNLQNKTNIIKRNVQASTRFARIRLFLISCVFVRSQRNAVEIPSQSVNRRHLGGCVYARNTDGDRPPGDVNRIRRRRSVNFTETSTFWKNGKKKTTL